MSRRIRHLVVLFVAVVTASISSFGVYKAMSRIPARQAARGLQYVVVAACSMALGTSLTEQDVRLVSGPPTVPCLAPSTRSRTSWTEACWPPCLNEPITSKLAAAQAGAGLPPAIPLGMRAIAVKVNDAIGVAGPSCPAAAWMWWSRCGAAKAA